MRKYVCLKYIYSLYINQAQIAEQILVKLDAYRNPLCSEITRRIFLEKNNRKNSKIKFQVNKLTLTTVP